MLANSDRGTATSASWNTIRDQTSGFHGPVDEVG
jgi:hypothetical protein